jgi:hypothetical protein
MLEERAGRYFGGIVATAASTMSRVSDDFKLAKAVDTWQVVAAPWARETLLRTCRSQKPYVDVNPVVQEVSPV